MNVKEHRANPTMSSPEEMGGQPILNRIRIMCVEDHRVVREGLILLLERHPEFEVVGIAATGREAIEVCRVRRPDFVLLDLQLPDMSGVDVLLAIRRMDEKARVIVLTMYCGDEDIRRAVDAGAAAYLLKETSSDTVIETIRDIQAGRDPAHSKIVAPASAAVSLTPREIEILELISRGMRNKAIALQTGISNKTVEVHVRNIMSKLDVHDRTAAVHVGVRRGIIRML